MSRLCRLSLAVAVALAVAAPATNAAPTVPVSGKFDVAFQGAPVARQVGSRCMISATATFVFSERSRGSGIVGSFTAPFDIIHYGACPPEPARETFVARGEFTGTVAGVQGSFRFVFRGTIDAEGHAEGTLTITCASNGLEGLTGTVELSGQSGCCGTYSGAVNL